MVWRAEDSLLLCQYVLDNLVKIGDLREVNLKEMQEKGFSSDITLQQCIGHLRKKISRGKRVTIEGELDAVRSYSGVDVEEISRVLDKEVAVVFYHLYKILEEDGLLVCKKVGRGVKWSKSEVEWVRGKIVEGVTTPIAYDMYKEKYGERRGADGFMRKYFEEKEKMGLTVEINSQPYTEKEKTLLYNLGLTRLATSWVKEEMEKIGYFRTETSIETFWEQNWAKGKLYGVIDKDKLKEVIKRWSDGGCVVEVATEMGLPVEQIFYNIRTLVVYKDAVEYVKEEEDIIAEGLRVKLTADEIHQKTVEWRIERGLPPRTKQGVKMKMCKMRKKSRE